jgi:Tfp pilus assembly protein PilO
MIETLKRFPFFMVFVAYAGYLGFQYYNFNYAPDGEVAIHKTKVQSAEAEIQTLKRKLAEGKKFMEALELKKAEVRELVAKLLLYQGALSEAPDFPSLMKVILTEAKKLEMKVDRIEPGKKNQREYYLEQEVKLEMRGTYQQFLLFMARIAQLQRILRVENYEMKLSPTTVTSHSITLSATLSIRAYQYTLSKEDQIAKGAALK